MITGDVRGETDVELGYVKVKHEKTLKYLTISVSEHEQPQTVLNRRYHTGKSKFNGKEYADNITKH